MLTRYSLLSCIVDSSIPDVLSTESGYRPGWLLSSYDAHEWTVQNIGDKRPKTIVFNVAVPGGGFLVEYPNLYDTIKRIAYGVRTGPFAEINSADVQQGLVNNLTTLACWMLRHGLTRFSQLTKADCEDYASAAQYGVDTILNSESVLVHYLEKLLSHADIQLADKPEVRRAKAKAVFPLSRASGGAVRLNRQRLLADAGLDHHALATSKVLASIFDETEQNCGLYLRQRVKARLQNSLDDLDDKSVSTEHLRRFLMSFKYLYDHRIHLEDAPTVDPFHGTSLLEQARRLGKSIGRTQTIPVTQATHLIERSIRWVLDYAPKILDIKNKADLVYDAGKQNAAEVIKESGVSDESWPSGPASPFPILGYGTATLESPSLVSYENCTSGIGISLQSAIVYLMTACGVVLAAFTARRASELVGLKSNCISYDKAGNPWLSCFIHKTLRVQANIPVPEVVVAAINVLEQLSSRSRELTGTPYLFQYNVPGTEKACGISEEGLPSFSFATYLRKFGYFVDVPSLPDGTRWTFKPHQFRRFFAILYIWVYKDGNWGALQYHLRHFTSEHTRRYVTETEIGQIIAQVSKEHTAEILANAAAGTIQAAGVLGSRLKQAAIKLRARLLKNVEVISERKYMQRLDNLVTRTGASLVGFPWGYCVTRSKKDKLTRNCSHSNNADFTKANEVTCNGCVFNLVTSSSAPFLNSALRMHREVADSPGAPLILKRASRSVCNGLTKTLAELEISPTSPSQN